MLYAELFHLTFSCKINHAVFHVHKIVEHFSRSIGSTGNRIVHRIDFNAGSLLDGTSFDLLCDELVDAVVNVASGQQTANEKRGARDFAIFRGL